jgi:hypothetical protein
MSLISVPSNDGMDHRLPFSELMSYKTRPASATVLRIDTLDRAKPRKNSLFQKKVEQNQLSRTEKPS